MMVWEENESWLDHPKVMELSELWTQIILKASGPSDTLETMINHPVAKNKLENYCQSDGDRCTIPDITDERRRLVIFN